MLLMKIVGFTLIATGVFGVFLSSFIVEKFCLWKDIKCDFDNEMDSDDIEKYQKMKASVNVKMLGMVAFLPGLVMLIRAFK